LCCGCGYRLTGELRERVSAVLPKCFDKRCYNKNYYLEQKGILPGVSLKQAAMIKHCSVATIRRNLFRFDIWEGFKPMRLKFNNKFLEWINVKD
jgi:hypothetical protein